MPLPRADTLEVDEDVRELLSLALLIRHGEGWYTQRSRSVGNPPESWLAFRPTILAPHSTRDSNHLALKQDRPNGETRDYEVGDIIRLEEHGYRRAEVERGVTSEGDSTDRKIGKDLDGPESGPVDQL